MVNLNKLKKSTVKQMTFSMLLLIMLGLQAVFAQERTISGNITSSEDYSPIPGVSIIITGTTTGTITDMDGNYQLSVPEGATLSVSSVGYVAQTINPGNRSTVNIILDVAFTELDEIVVIGYGTMKKSDLTGAVVSVKADDLTAIQDIERQQNCQEGVG